MFYDIVREDNFLFNRIQTVKAADTEIERFRQKLKCRSAINNPALLLFLIHTTVFLELLL